MDKNKKGLLKGRYPRFSGFYAIPGKKNTVQSNHLLFLRRLG